MLVQEWTGNGQLGLDPTWQTFNTNIVYDKSTFGSTVLRWDGTGTRLMAKSPLGLTECAFSFEYYKTANPASSQVIVGPQTTAAAVAWRIRQSSGGGLIVDNSSSTQVGSTSSALSNNTWYRIEGRQTATTFELKIFDRATNTQLGSTVSATSTFGGVDNFRIGQINSTPNLATFYVANIVIHDSATATLGPVADGENPLVAPTVALIGDSLLYMSPNATTPIGEGPVLIREALEARNVHADSMYLWGLGGKKITGADLSGRSSLVNYTDATTMLGTPDYAVIALGTNNSPDSDSTINTAIDTLLAAISTSTHIVWVGLASQGTTSTRYMEVNALIQAKIAARTNAEYADWNAYIRSIDGGVTPYPALWQSDGIHMTHDGYVERAEFIASFIDVSSETRTASGTVTISGTANATVSYTKTATGSVALSGTATSSVILPRSAAGYLAVSGSSASGIALQAQGNIAVTGSSSYAISTYAVGVLTLSGIAVSNVVITKTATGNLALSGTAQSNVSGGAIAVTATGNLSLSASTAYLIKYALVSNAILNISGSAISSPQTVLSAVGNLQISGLATSNTVQVLYSVGTLLISGQGVVGSNEVIPDKRTLKVLSSRRTLYSLRRTISESIR